MPGQGFDDNWKKCLIYVAEVMAVYGLIWFIIGISATWFESPFLFTQHPSEVRTESMVRNSFSKFQGSFSKFGVVGDTYSPVWTILSLNTQIDLVLPLTGHLWPIFGDWWGEGGQSKSKMFDVKVKCRCWRLVFFCQWLWYMLEVATSNARKQTELLNYRQFSQDISYLTQWDLAESLMKDWCIYCWR